MHCFWWLSGPQAHEVPVALVLSKGARQVAPRNAKGPDHRDRGLHWGKGWAVEPERGNLPNIPLSHATPLLTLSVALHCLWDQV